MEFPYFHHLSCEGLPGVLGIREHDHLFQGNKGYFLLNGTLTKHFGEQWNLLTGSKEERVKFSREQGNVLPPPSLGGPPMWLLTALVSI